MSKRIFLLNNWITLSVITLALIFARNDEQFVSIIFALFGLKIFQAFLYATYTYFKKFSGIGVLFLIATIFIGQLFTFTTVVIQTIMIIIVAFEIFVHVMDAYIQYKNADRDWFINVLIAILFLSFLFYALFDSQRVYLNSFFILIIGFSSLYYLCTYYFTGEIKGNYTLINVNKALYRDSFIPAELYTKFANADEASLKTLVEKEQFGQEIPLPKYYFTVYLHTWKPAHDMMGHADLGIDNTAFTFSNYDVEKMKFGGMISTGTFGISNLKKYLNYCIDCQKKLVIGYTLEVSQDEFMRIHDVIKRFQDISSPWKPNDINNNAKALEFLQVTEGHIIQINKGPFRNYFALGANCVKLVDVVLNEIGIKTGLSPALITPGQYVKLLNENKDGRVIRKQVYWKDINYENIV